MFDGEGPAIPNYLESMNGYPRPLAAAALSVTLAPKVGCARQVARWRGGSRERRDTPTENADVLMRSVALLAQG